MFFPRNFHQCSRFPERASNSETWSNFKDGKKNGKFWNKTDIWWIQLRLVCYFIATRIFHQVWNANRLLHQMNQNVFRLPASLLRLKLHHQSVWWQLVHYQVSAWKKSTHEPSLLFPVLFPQAFHQTGPTLFRLYSWFDRSDQSFELQRFHPMWSCSSHSWREFYWHLDLWLRSWRS